MTAIDIDRERVLRAYDAGAVDSREASGTSRLAGEGQCLRGSVSVEAPRERSDPQAREREERGRAGGTPVPAPRRERQRLRDLLLDPNGHIATWNKGAERIEGYKASEIIGKHFSIFYPPEVAATGKCETELEVAAQDGRFEEEGWRVRKDGTRLWANVTITALRDPASETLIGFAKVTRDLTERVRNESTLQQLAAERAAHAEKARVQEFQERFIAILGHDLRNPLSAIDMGTGLLRQRSESLKDEASVRVLDRMKGSARRMSRMIEQILD